MKFFRIEIAATLLALLVLSAVGVSAAQAIPDHVVSTNAFAPFELWKSAVLAGDSTRLASLYTSDPPTEITVGKNKLDGDADVAFWTGLKATKAKFEVLKDELPKPDLRVLAFKAEIESGPSSQPRIVYVNAALAWVHSSGQWLVAGGQRTEATLLQQPASKGKNIYPPDADAHAEIKESEAKAAKENKRVLLVFGANWCYDCHVLDLAFHRPDFADAVAGYEVVHVDIGDDGKKNGDIAQEFDVPLNKGIPAVAVLDGSGKLLVSQKNGEFENARAMTPQALLEFLNHWKPAAR